MAVRVLNPELVQLRIADRGDELAGYRVHRVEEVGGALHRVDAAAAVVGRVVVKPDPSCGEAIGAVHLIVALADRELCRLHVRYGVGLRLQTKLGDN